MRFEWPHEVEAEARRLYLEAHKRPEEIVEALRYPGLDREKVRRKASEAGWTKARDPAKARAMKAEAARAARAKRQPKALSPAMAEAKRLFVVEELSVREAAAQAGLSVEAVERVRMSLRWDRERAPSRIGERRRKRAVERAKIRAEENAAVRRAKAAQAATARAARDARRKAEREIACDEAAKARAAARPAVVGPRPVKAAPAKPEPPPVRRTPAPLHERPPVIFGRLKGGADRLPEGRALREELARLCADRLARGEVTMCEAGPAAGLSPLEVQHGSVSAWASIAAREGAGKR